MGKEEVEIMDGPVAINLIYVIRAKVASKLDKEVIVRLDPKQFLEYLPELKQYFESK